MPEQSSDYNVVVFGSSGVGKSALIRRFIGEAFIDVHTPTVEDTYRQLAKCHKQVCTLCITDTAGSRQFPAMSRLSISRAHAFVLVYSVTSRKSLAELQDVLRDIAETRGPGAPMLLVGNKIDLESAREVSPASGAAIGANWSCGYAETSARDNKGVEEAFAKLLHMDTGRGMELLKRVPTRKRKANSDSSVAAEAAAAAAAADGDDEDAAAASKKCRIL